MISLDAVNGSFELAGACIQWIQVRQILKDRSVKGVHWLPILFFSTWGLWNLYYYPSLDQYLSFIGGLLLTTANTIWLGLIIKYSYKRIS